MSATHDEVAHSPKDALAAYIWELGHVYYPWYAKKQKSYKVKYELYQLLTIVAGFGTSLIAALMQEEYFKGLGWGRILLVVLPSIGSLAATLSTQTRVLHLARLRERGREKVQHLVSLAKADYAAIDDPEKASALHKWLIEQVSELEQEQADGYLGGIETVQDDRRP